MTSVKTRKLDISTILAVVKAQNSSGAIEPVTSGNALLTEQTNFGVASTITFPATANTRVSRNINTIKYNTLGNNRICA